MATLSQYIKQKFERFSIWISDEEIEFLSINFGFLPTDEYTLENKRTVELAIASIIPEMILVPSVSEGGYAVSRNYEGLMDYYDWLCSELGIENKLKPKPQIRDRSNLW